MSRRTLPLPDRLVSVLRAAKARQAVERLALGADSGPWDYVVSNEAGHPYHARVLSRYWRDAVKAAGLRTIKLHAARHTARRPCTRRRARCGDRGVGRAQGRQPDHAPLRALARPRVEGRR